MRRFGKRFWLRYAFTATVDGLRPIPLAGMDPIFVRPGESDLEVARQILIQQSYQFHPQEVHDRVQGRYEAILAAGKRPIIVDAGANIGVSSIWFAREYEDARIVAIEPDQGSLAVLRKNVGAFKNCIVLDAALGGERGFATLTNSEENLAWTVQTERSISGIPIVTVQDAFEASGGDEPFIVKIDIEGFERDVFASNVGWLESTYVVILEPHDWMFPGKRTSATFQRAMAEMPFELFLRGENLIYVRI